ncbi:MAG: NAD-dependent epimerase/dehydratase family protein [Clostridia bacterium]|nr:NAD-dependent epimerase/dehydratase family protein [Clostridia bacterium]
MLMNILVTGAKGFAGRNLVTNLCTLRDGKNRTRPAITIGEIYEYDIDSTTDELREYCSKADFVFHLAGVNRPKDVSEFAGNYGILGTVLEALKSAKNSCPVMLSSSVQATLEGRFAGSEYGKSKLSAENVLFDYAKETGAKALVYRLPNLFGKWCRPNYNSAVATFCNNIAKDLPITVNDPSVELELLYIDDFVEEMLNALEGKETKCGDFCGFGVTHKVTLGEIVELLEKFRAQAQTLLMPSIPDNSFAKKLYSTYLSYLPKEKISIPLRMNSDARGSFTEILKTENCGQFSVNVSNPAITKGQHWHNTKWEFFIVVSVTALIQQREIGSDEVLEFRVSGDKPEAVHMLPGFTHNIINLSETENLVTLMWANEQFNPDKPDTFFEIV